MFSRRSDGTGRRIDASCAVLNAQFLTRLQEPGLYAIEVRFAPGLKKSLGAEIARIPERGDARVNIIERQRNAA